jgi:septum formation protein
MKIILASSSKLKSDLLDTVGIKHSCIGTEEPIVDEKDFYKFAMAKSLGKAKSVKAEGIIIGLDTITIINNKIVEKPKSLEEAKQNIIDASNNTTSVITGFTIINTETNETITDYAESFITLREIPECDIDYYIENEPSALYASGFILETYISNFIEEIKGSYYNIIGVPVEKIYKVLEGWNIHLKDME